MAAYSSCLIDSIRQEVYDEKSSCSILERNREY